MNVFKYVLDNLLSTNVTTASCIFKLLLSFILGGLIGVDRQRRRQSAGIRTFAIISSSSTAAMLLSVWIPQMHPDLLNGDPGRIAAQILTGIGFLGAGSIIQSKGGVTGLTTAASIWLVAIVGMCVGAGMLYLALVIVCIALFALFFIGIYEKNKFISGETKHLVIKFDGVEIDEDLLKKMLKKEHIFLVNISIDKDLLENKSIVTMRVNLNRTNCYNELFEDIQKLENVTAVKLMMR